MIMLALSAMVGTSKVMTPYLTDLAHRDDTGRFQHLASHLLLTTGTPTNWGQLADSVPSTLGLAKANALQPYELDIDKVTRLNSENLHSLDYSELWQALGVKDASFHIEVRTLFQLSIELISNSTQGSDRVYEFEITASKSGLPISTRLHSYVVLKDFVNETMSSTSSDGVGTFEIGIPNSINGTTLLLVFAQATVNPQMVSLGAHSFGHNSDNPLPNGTFARLSPLDYVLNATFNYTTVEVSKAQVFTFSYNFSLSVRTQGVQTAEYSIPRLLDASPMVMVLTGVNGSTSFAEFVAYPQAPLQIGADFNESIAGSRIAVYRHAVTINSALYEVVTNWGGLSSNV
jgi:hypothetical protein